MTPDRKHNQRRDGRGRRESDHAIDRLLDGGLSREQSQELLREIRRDAGACEDLARTRLCLDRLREPVDAPDMTDAILSRAHSRRRFLPQAGRRFVTVGRVAVAAGLVGAVALASFVQRHAPEVRLDEQPAPVTRFVEAAAPAAPEPARLGQAVESLQASIAAPVRTLTLSPRYRPEGQFHFDLSLDRVREADVTTTALPQAFAVGVPFDPQTQLQVDPQAQLRTPLETQAETRLISRFGSLLVILREPPGAIDDQSADE